MATRTTETGEKRIFMLKSSDGGLFEVEEDVAIQFQTIKGMIEDDCANNENPLHNVTRNILSKIIEYCKKHTEFTEKDTIENKAIIKDLKSWDSNFIKVDRITLFELIQVISIPNYIIFRFC